MIGKVDPETLAALVLGRTGAADEAVLQGPAYGEDTAAIDLGEQVLVINSDPISLAVDRVGTLGVAVACNDVAASGARPRWLTSVVFLPGDDETLLDRITAQLDEAAREQGVAIVGGHSEYAPALSTPLLVLTCLGVTDRYVPSAGARPGDRIVLAGSAGIEATAILATDFRDRVADAVPAAVVDRAATFYNDVSVVAAGTALAEHARAMHDPTEGGLVDGLLEMAVASGVRIAVDRDDVPVRDETARLCAAAGVDPLRTFGSGALVAAVPPDAVSAALAALDDAGIEGTVVGRVVDGDPALVLDEDVIETPVRDEMYPLWE
ncbi:MAG: AIR synthase family protein [Haloarculaceae archaeon]